MRRDPYASIVKWDCLTPGLLVLRLKTKIGKLDLWGVLAPHQGRPLEERTEFFEDLKEDFDNKTRRGPGLLIGDFNSRIFAQQPNEERYVGKHALGSQCPHPQVLGLPYTHPTLNRALLMDACKELDLRLPATYQPRQDYQKATFAAPGVAPGGEVTIAGFAQLDHLAVQIRWANLIGGVRSRRHITASRADHLPLEAESHLRTAKLPKPKPKPKYEVSASFRDDEVRQKWRPQEEKGHRMEEQPKRVGKGQGGPCNQRLDQ